MLRYHRHSLKDARMWVSHFKLAVSSLTDFSRLELGAGGGLVGLGVAIGCQIGHPIYITDQQNMLELMAKNIMLNLLESRVIPLVLNWYFDNPFSRN